MEKSCPLGQNISQQVSAEQISPKWVRLSTLNKPQKDWDLTQKHYYMRSKHKC